MNLTSHVIVRGLVVGIPMPLTGLWAWLQRRRAKENERTSSILQRRST
jgi:hypothetical protein